MLKLFTNKLYFKTILDDCFNFIELIDYVNHYSDFTKIHKITTHFEEFNIHLDVFEYVNNVTNDKNFYDKYIKMSD